MDDNYGVVGIVPTVTLILESGLSFRSCCCFINYATIQPGTIMEKRDLGLLDQASEESTVATGGP